MAKGSRNVAVPSRSDSYQSVTVRPIDNGFLICRSTDKGYSEVFSASKPKIEVPNAPKAKATPAKPSPVARAASAGKKR